MHVVLLIDFLKKIEECDIFYTRIKKEKDTRGFTDKIKRVRISIDTYKNLTLLSLLKNLNVEISRMKVNSHLNRN